ncbi:hypothetical protein CLV92_106246 [Kineococcus xinjiangensis]|uniref:Uncharacterized protein n=1 Tax=Kineococcus xinjiangensis TaxID=512762 RepID=A0A2S6IMG9_9ACTN|nr:hypothetical protein [Kineococcus xinjiangensis]PPK95423.1 hypothetical protein CLV92_106246 [Kineococcus xinjiangensis]
MSVDTRAADRVRIDPAPGAHGLAQARRFLGRYAQQSGFAQERADDLVQAAAELMAVGGGPHRVTAVAVRQHRGHLTVLVDLDGLDRVDVADEAAELLNGLSREWGWRRLPGRTQVWCDVSAQEAQA